MEKVEQRLSSLSQSFKTLEDSLKIIKKPEYKDIYHFLRDSVIQRFEYSIDGFWKFLKIYIQENKNIQIDFANPRETLRTSLHMNILDEKDFKILLEGMRHRNLTSHIYNEKRAEEIFQEIPRYHKTMKRIIENIKL